jgi:hypothetical protein
MSWVYVARSAKLGKWGSDVGLSKNLFKIGCTDSALKPLVAGGWAGETDWSVIRKQQVEAVDEEEIIRRLALKEKMLDPSLYPKLKGARGIFKVPPDHVENHIVVGRAMAGDELIDPGKLKPADFADYLIHNALS